MDLFHAAVLGTVQGLTEFLPVSSTAHLLIAERILGFSDPGSVFTVIIQFGSMLALMWLYRAKILEVVSRLGSDPEARRFALMIGVGVLPAFVVGALMSSYVKNVLHGSTRVIALALINGGIIMLVVERLRPPALITQAERTPLGRAFGVGLFQAVAIIPGISRSGATIVGGMLLRLERVAAAELSFFLAIPTLAGAFAHDLWEVRHQLSGDLGAEIAVGFVMAFLAALLVVKPFLAFIGRAGFAPFAWYRIVAGLLILLLM